MAETEIKRVIKIESSESLNTLNNLSSRIKELKENMGDLDITTDEYRRVSEEVNQLENVKRNAIRGVTAAVEGSYNAYSKELSILQKHRKTLQETSAEYREVTARVAELQQKLKDMDADVGVYSRNVGNYSSAFDGLQGSVDNVAKKLPQLASGFAGFAASLVEDLPKVFESLQGISTTAPAAAVGTAAMGTAAQGASVGIKALIRAMTSWNVILLAIITLCQIFADNIERWIEKLSESTVKLTENEKALQAVNEEIKNGSYGLGEMIVKLREMQDAWNTLGNNMEAKKKYIEENKEAFDALGVAINDVSSAERLLEDYTEAYVNAMKERAKATAASKIAAERYEKAITTQIEREEAERKLATIPKYVDQTRATISGGGGAAYGYAGAQLVNAEYTEQERKVKSLEEEEKAAMALADSYFELAKAKDEASNRILSEAGINATSTPTITTTTTTSATHKATTSAMSKDDLIALTGGAIDASASREALRATLEARIKMTTANAEERKVIEEQLAKDLADIESARLELHIANLEAMLQSDMLTSEQRLSIEEELMQAKINLNDIEIAEREKTDAALIEAEKKRAAEEKAIKDKEAKEEEAREKAKEKAKAALAASASNLLKQTASLLQENSKEQKALNAASIVMDTFTAAMAGFKSGMELPAPIGAIVAAANVAASIAMGATQLKNLMQVAPDGSNVEGALSAAQSAPNVSSSMPASYTRSLQGDNELTEMNKDTRVYVVESDITNAQKSARVRVESATF